ncbi:acetyltransferase [Penicillium lividum]|nr:acetyltransferase [Penicillium lividum]
MAASNTLKLDLVTLEDSSALIDIWFAAFSDPGSRRLFPHTAGVRSWLEDAIHRDLGRSFQRYLKVIDTGSKDADGKSRIAAYAKWDLATPEERGPRYPPWHSDMPRELCEAFVTRGESNRKRVMGDQKHICMFSRSMSASGIKDLDIVATHPEYQRQGAASMLVKWGCDLADVEGLKTYVSASRNGASLYVKFGFVDYSITGQDTISMARPWRSQT